MAKMYLLCVFLLIAAVLLPATGKEIVPTIVNVTCNDIKTPGGYMFDIKPVNQDPVESVDITQNGVKIYVGKFEDLSWSSKGRDVKAITTTNCSSINVKWTHNTTEGYIVDSYLDINAVSESETKETKETEQSSTDSNWPIIIACTVIAVFVVIVCGLLWAWCKKKRRGCVDEIKNRCVNKQPGTSNVDYNRSDDDNSNNAQREALLHKRSENGMSNGGTDVSIDMQACTTDKNNDDEIAPQVNGIVLHKDRKGNMGHDPGGGKDTTLHCNGDLSHHDKSTGEQQISGDEEDGCSSAFNQRSTREEPFDETAGSEGRAPVHGVGPGRARISPPDNEANHKASANMLNNNNK
ncbi:unnamed protein product [Knipowitschia caucasica]